MNDDNNNTAYAICDYCAAATVCHIVKKWSKDNRYLINRGSAYVCPTCRYDVIQRKEIYLHNYNEYLFTMDSTSQMKF